MYTIRQAAELTGVPATSLRAWERRYGVAAPLRTDAGYRLYDDRALRIITAIRRLIDQGWSAGQAAHVVLAKTEAAGADLVLTHDGGFGPAGRRDDLPDDDAGLTAAFVGAAGAMDDVHIGRVLDAAFSRGSFESVVDEWLMPTLRELGDAWVRGDIDISAEHFASHAVLRRLAACFEAAGDPRSGPLVVVGLPAGCRHELAALAFATALRRAGVRVRYIGADVPAVSWVHAVTVNKASSAVVGIPTAGDVSAGRRTVYALKAAGADLLVAAGGAAVDAESAGDALPLPRRITDAVRLLDRRLALR